MESGMKNKELIAEMANRSGWTMKEVSDVLADLSVVISSRLVDNDTICLPGFGQFEVKKKAERISVNPVYKIWRVYYPNVPERKEGRWNVSCGTSSP